MKIVPNTCAKERMKSPAEYPFVMVEWLDSRQYHEPWYNVDDVEIPQEHDMLNFSGGFLIQANELSIIVARDYGPQPEKENTQVGGLIEIPTKAVVKIHTILKAGNPQP